MPRGQKFGRSKGSHNTAGREVFPLAYRPGGDAVIQRLRRFYEQRPADGVLAVMNPPSAARHRFSATHPGGYCDYPDPEDRIAFWDACLRERADIDDDSIPCAYLSEMDQGLYGALVGGRPQFLCDPETGWVSSMVEPILRDLSEVDGLSIRDDHPWFQKYIEQLGVFVRGARGRFGVSHFILINGLNFLFELVGATKTYEELLDRPDLVRRAMDLGYQVNLRVQQAFFEHTPLLEGGTCSNMVQWIPGRIISESVDPFHMTGVPYFNEWGRPVLERVFARFEGGVTHIHANGRHLLEAVAAVDGLKAIYLGDDTGFPSSFDILPQVRRRVGNMPLATSVPYDRFTASLADHSLTGGVMYWVKDVPDADAANRCMDRVRQYRAG